MAVTRKHAPQQPPGPPRPKQAPSPGLDTQSGSSTLAPTPTPASPASPASQGPGTEGQAPSADLNFSHILEQQIIQAIGPVLDEFRQQMAQGVAQQTADTPGIDLAGQGIGQGAAQGSGAQAPTPQPPSQQSPAPLGQAAPAAPTERPDIQTQVPVKNIVQRPLSGALAPAVQAVEQHGAEWLQSLLVAGLGALLTESTHVAVQQRAEQGLHTLLQKLFDAAPDGVTNQEIQGKIERTLQLILRESLDAVFVEGVRTVVQQGGQQTIERSLRGDFGGALIKVEDMLKVMVTALIAVLHRHQQTLLRLLLALALLALENSLMQPEKSK
jgi:hypothetical protein